MKKIKFGIIGGGWRSKYFVRAAKGIKETFEITSVLMRDGNKADLYEQEMGVDTTLSFEQFMEQKPDYVILTVPRDVMLEWIEKLFEQNMPILCETPPGKSIEEYEMLWNLIQKYNGKIQVAEQYFAWPLYSAWLNVIKEGLMGQVSNVSLSALHGYHGINIIRRLLGVTTENCKIIGKRYSFPVTSTCSRAGRTFEGKEILGERQKITFEFDNGKVAFFDFSDAQYFSQIRTRQLNIQGTRGEIDDLTVRYLNLQNEIVTQTLFRDDQGIYDISEWANYGLMLGDRYVYRSPFPKARLNDDELSVATIMYQMKEFIECGAEFYSMKEALQDSYLAIKMEECLENPMTEISTETQVWYQ